MAKIRIKDLPKDQKINKEEMRKVIGGGSYDYSLVQGIQGNTVPLIGGGSFVKGPFSGSGVNFLPVPMPPDLSRK